MNELRPGEMSVSFPDRTRAIFAQEAAGVRYTVVNAEGTAITGGRAPSFEEAYEHVLAVRQVRRSMH